MTQIAENPYLADVFDGLFTVGGDTLHLKPATGYVLPDREVTFATVVESGLRQGHCVIGFRLHEGGAQGPSYGVRINPDKRERVRLAAEDSVIVLAPKPVARARFRGIRCPRGDARAGPRWRVWRDRAWSPDARRRRSVRTGLRRGPGFRAK